MVSSVGLKIIPTKANDLIYQAVQVAIKKNDGGNIAVEVYAILSSPFFFRKDIPL